MKPTVSYVRGLRDVLELSKDERKYYVINQRREKEAGNSVDLMTCLMGFGASIIGSALLFEGHRNLSIGFLCVTYGGIACRTYLRRRLKKSKVSRKKIEIAGRAYQENFLNNTTIPAGLEREAFNNVI